MIYSIKVFWEANMGCYTCGNSSVISGDGIDKAVGLLLAGGIVAYPTDTVYGLGADIESEVAVKRIIDLKGRSAAMGLPILISEIGGLSTVSDHISALVLETGRYFWPGPLTIIMPRSKNISNLLTGGRDTIAVRVPDHPVPLQIISKLGRPITGTSANFSGNSSILDAIDLQDGIGIEVDFVLESKVESRKIESTILDLSGKVPLLIRQGAISENVVRSFLAELGENLSVK
jgi:L-threonylcarbamoyladenylate synthase